jgi:predicted cupin superfamily sugar epimerase
MDVSETIIEQLIKRFDLKPLKVEGGLFNRGYVSEESYAGRYLPARYEGLDRPFGSAIYYFYTSDPDSFSAMHVLPSDEIYHFYLGDPVELLFLYPDGSSRHIILGQDVLGGQEVQVVVPKGVWQGSRLLPGGLFALCGTTMGPGYIEEDFLGADRDALIARYPHETELIRFLTRPGEPLRKP